MPNSGWPNASTSEPFDVGDGAGGDGAHVAAHQLDADRRAGLDVAGGRRPGLRPPPACSGTRPVGRSSSASSATVRGVKPRPTAAPTRACRRGSPLAGAGADGRQAQPARQRVGRPDAACASASAPRMRRRDAQPPRRPGASLLRRPPSAKHLVRHAARAAPLGQHRLDRRDAAERLLGEAPGVGDRAHQLAVDVDRAAAHAGDDAGELDARILGADQDDVLLGQEVPHHRDDPDLERLRLGALEDGERLADHPRLHVGERHDGRRRARRHDGAQPDPLGGRRGGRGERARTTRKTGSTRGDARDSRG